MRKLPMLIFVVALSVSLFYTPKMMAENNIEKTHFKLDLNQRFTENSNTISLNKTGIQRYIGHEISKMPVSFVDLNLNLRDIKSPDHKIATGNGVLKVGNDTFPFQVEEQPFPVITLPDGKVIHIGGLTGKVHTKAGESELILGMEYIPSTNAAFISAFIGELNEQTGLGIMRFGNPVLTKEMGEAVEAVRKKEREKNSATEGSAQ